MHPDDYIEERDRHLRLYQALGYRLTPIPRGHKFPKGIPEWQNRASPDITRWENTDHGIGWVLGEQPNGDIYIMLDVDTHDGKPGPQRFLELINEKGGGGPTAAAPLAFTGGGGQHYAFRTDTDFGNGIFHPDIGEYKSGGGFVVVPPTIHPVTQLNYEWAPGRAPWEIEDIPPLPKAFRTIIIDGHRQKSSQLIERRPAAMTEPDLDRPAPTEEFDPADWVRNNIRYETLLEQLGWQHAGGEQWTRPGKNVRDGTSATLHEGGPLVVWSTTAQASFGPLGRPVDGGARAYSPLELYAAAHHANNLTDTARTIREQHGPPPPKPFDMADIVPAPEGGDPTLLLGLVDWATLDDETDDIIEGFLFPGRWTAVAAAAKAGKSTLSVYAAIKLSQGEDPWSGEPVDPLPVYYLDAEMGRFDMAERLRDNNIEPTEDPIPNFYYKDGSLTLNREEIANQLLHDIAVLGVRVLVIDGINGVVDGAEKDDEVWRDFYRYTIEPLKIAGVAIITNDNLGKDTTLGPRGSSVKLDKPDAVFQVKRSDDGPIKVTATHRRTGLFRREFELEVDNLEVVGEPLKIRRPGADQWPHGTKQCAIVLRELGVPAKAGRPACRKALAAAANDHPDDRRRYSYKNDVIQAAQKWRRKGKHGG